MNYKATVALGASQSIHLNAQTKEYSGTLNRRVAEDDGAVLDALDDPSELVTPWIR
jgi:hypothetical protein